MPDEFDYLPCFIKGTLVRQGVFCDFVIRAGGTAEVLCDDQQFFYGCSGCEKFF